MRERVEKMNPYTLKGLGSGSKSCRGANTGGALATLREDARGEIRRNGKTHAVPGKAKTSILVICPKMPSGKIIVTGLHDLTAKMSRCR